MTADPLNPTLFRLDRKGMQIYISDLKSETESTFAVVDFRPKNQKKTFEDIIAKCSGRQGIDQKLLEEEINAQLVTIYFEYAQQEEQKEASKQAGKAAKKDSDSKRIIENRVPYWLFGGVAYEAIHLNGQPVFLCFDKTKFWTEPEIVISEDDDTKEVLIPPSIDDIPYEPYSFTVDEIQNLPPNLPDDSMERAYETILNTISPYQETEPFNLQTDSAGILLSYHQHKCRSVPYIAKVAAPESGKTRGLEMISYLAYRPMMGVDITPANVYRYYGKHVQGAGVLIHDEIDEGNIDYDKALRAIYNAGYKYGAKVPRIGGEHNDEQSFYNPFGIKWFGGTELPNSKTFRSRCIVQKYMQGIPEKIEITDEDMAVFRSVRKRLLVLRMFKAFDKFEPVNTGLTGRSRELYTPLLSVVQGTPWYGKLLAQLERLDQERHAEDQESKQAYVAKAVINCWLDAARTKLQDEKIATVLDGKLDNLRESVFVSNNAVIANMDLKESANEKGRKILVSDEIPYAYSHYDIGKIQAENLKGSRDMAWIEDNTKKVRGYSYELRILRALHRRYIGTLGTSGTHSGETKGARINENARSDHGKNDTENGVGIPPTSVPSVPDVPSVTELIQCPKPNCPLKLKSVKLVIEHGIKAHKGFPITAELATRGYKID